MNVSDHIHLLYAEKNSILCRTADVQANWRSISRTVLHTVLDCACPKICISCSPYFIYLYDVNHIDDSNDELNINLLYELDQYCTLVSLITITSNSLACILYTSRSYILYLYVLIFDAILYLYFMLLNFQWFPHDSTNIIHITYFYFNKQEKF